MGIEILLALLGGATSLIAGRAATTEVFQRLIRKLLREPRTETAETYAARLERLTGDLAKSSREVDQILGELSRVARDRETAVQHLEAELAELSAREQQLQKRIEDLQNVPLPVVEHFAALTASGEKRSAKRDYLLFGAGVLVSTVVSVIFFLLGG